MGSNTIVKNEGGVTILTISVKAFRIETDMGTAFIVFFALLGAVVASFLNVCCDRLPKKKSLLFPPSHCPACKRRLKPLDLVPVFSYLWLRGRCRYCRAAIPRRVLAVELGTGLLFAYLYWHYMLRPEDGSAILLAVATIYCCLLVVLLVIDLEHGLILNKIVYPALAVTLVVSIFLPPSRLTFYDSSQLGIVQAAIGGGIGFALFFLIVIISRGGMGWGDVKMAALIGIVTGFPLVFVALLLGIIIGGLVAVVLLLSKKKKRREAIPFGPFLSVATIVTLLWGSSILHWYLSLFS